MLILISLILIKYSMESKAEINYLSETNNDLKLLSYLINNYFGNIRLPCVR